MTNNSKFYSQWIHEYINSNAFFCKLVTNAWMIILTNYFPAPLDSQWIIEILIEMFSSKLETNAWIITLTGSSPIPLD